MSAHFGSHVLVLATALIAALPDASPAAAQAVPIVEPDAWVRIAMAGGVEREGRLVATGRDTIHMANGAQDTIAIPRSLITGLQVSTGTSRRTLAGMGRGFLVGTLLGGVASLTAMGMTDAGSADVGPLIAAGAGLGAVTGLLLGAVIGATRVRHDWVPASLPERVAVTVGSSGAIGLSLRLR